MKTTFRELITFIKKPSLTHKSGNSNTFTVFLHIFILSILTGMFFGPILSLIQEMGWVDMENHAMKELMEKTSKLTVFALAVIAAPIIEELIFRAPLTLFKKPLAFKIGFYFLTIAFGLVHLSNFVITNNVIYFAPILVAPQIVLGGYLGFIRVKFGLLYSILLHAAYNAFFILGTFAADLM